MVRAGCGMSTLSNMAIALAARRLLDTFWCRLDRLDDLVADRMHRAERGHRLLEDHGDLAAADAANLCPMWVKGRQVNGLAHL